MITITPEAYRQALSAPFISDGMKEMIHRRFLKRVSAFRASAANESGWNLAGDDAYSVATDTGVFHVAVRQTVADSASISGLRYLVTAPDGEVVIEAVDDLECPGDKVASLLNGVIALCRPSVPWGEVPLADIRDRHLASSTKKGIEYELASFGWAKSEQGFTYEIGGARKTPENPEGLRALEVRLADDLGMAEFFFGEQKVAWVPLDPCSVSKSLEAIERTASAMDFGYTRPDPAPLPDNFNPVQLIEYLYSRYADRLGRIEQEYLYEIRTESWDGICALQTEEMLAEVYIPSFTRHFPSGDICGVYHRRQESGTGWAEKEAVEYHPGTEQSRSALERAKRLGVELPVDEPLDENSIYQTVKKAKMAI